VSESIVTSNLTKYYGSQLGVKNLTLTVNKGEVFGFLGPNGAGKTTTIRLLMGLIRPTSGNIRVLDRDTESNRKEILREIGYLPGEVGLYGDLTGSEYLSHLMKLRIGNANRNAFRRLTDLQERFDIDYNRRIKSYSKGMRQVLGVIQAFMHDPCLVVLDEPTSGLDPVMQERFYELVTNEKNAGKTVFLSSHILAEVERLCDRVGFIKKGELVAVEQLGDRRSIAGKKVRISLHEHTQVAMKSLDLLAGVKSAEIDNDYLAFFYNGSMKKLVEWASTFELEDFICETPTVEDFFISLYGG
jgi:ABC-2 type transport system ATP-binding protein